MDQINAVELVDESVYPDDEVLRRVLGPSFAAYALLLELFSGYGMTHEWRYYRDGKAWLCKVQLKKRTIVWMSAWREYIKATIYFPQKYTKGLFALDLPAETGRRIRRTQPVGKSIPCMFEIRDIAVLPEVDVVIRYKIASK